MYQLKRKIVLNKIEKNKEGERNFSLKASVRASSFVVEA